MRTIARTTAAIALLLSSAVLPAVFAEETAKPGLGRFQANAVSLGGLRVGGTGGPSGSSRIDFEIQRTSTDAEREALLAALTSGGSGELSKVLAKMEPVGRILPEGRLGYDLRYAREIIEQDGTRHIILATDRPIHFTEPFASRRTMDYEISIVELLVDANGKGTGTAIPAAQVELDKASGDIRIVNLSTSPVQLLNVHQPKR